MSQKLLREVQRFQSWLCRSWSQLIDVQLLPRGMDPYSRRATWNIIRAAREGRVVVLTTHFMDEAKTLWLCGSVCWLWAMLWLLWLCKFRVFFLLKDMPLDVPCYTESIWKSKNGVSPRSSCEAEILGDRVATQCAVSEPLFYASRDGPTGPTEVWKSWQQLFAFWDRQEWQLWQKGGFVFVALLSSSRPAQRIRMAATKWIRMHNKQWTGHSQYMNKVHIILNVLERTSRNAMIPASISLIGIHCSLQNKMESQKPAFQFHLMSITACSLHLWLALWERTTQSRVN